MFYNWCSKGKTLVECCALAFAALFTAIEIQFHLGASASRKGGFQSIEMDCLCERFCFHPTCSSAIDNSTYT